MTEDITDPHQRRKDEKQYQRIAELISVKPTAWSKLLPWIPAVLLPIIAYVTFIGGLEAQAQTNSVEISKKADSALVESKILNMTLDVEENRSNLNRHKIEAEQKFQRVYDNQDRANDKLDRVIELLLRKK